MGIENRDYIRQTPHFGAGFGGGGGRPWVIKFLLIANIVVFLLDNGGANLNDWLSLQFYATGAKDAEFYVTEGRGIILAGKIPKRTSVILADTVLSVPGPDGPTRLYEVRFRDRNTGEGRIGFVAVDALHFAPQTTLQIWRFVTYGFCHGGLMHIAFNMYFLWMFGQLIEPVYGSREFLAFYLVAVVFSGLCYLGVEAVGGSPAVMVGASGGVYGVVFLAAMMYPRQKLLLMLVIPVEFRWMAVLYAVVNLAGFIQGGSNVAHMAHLGGAAFGVAYRHFDWRIDRSWTRLTASLKSGVRRKPSNIRIYQPDPSNRADLDEQVDEILAKISREGEASLTDRERDILARASRQYRDR